MNKILMKKHKLFDKENVVVLTSEEESDLEDELKINLNKTSEKLQKEKNTINDITKKDTKGHSGHQKWGWAKQGVKEAHNKMIQFGRNRKYSWHIDPSNNKLYKNNDSSQIDHYSDNKLENNNNINTNNSNASAQTTILNTASTVLSKVFYFSNQDIIGATKIF